MKVEDAVDYVGKRFKYRSDPKIFDYWFVMPERDGVVIGDCDDFAITSIWKICDGNIFKFLLNVFILHRYRIYFAKTVNGEKHAVGYAQGMYFDNWSRKALSKEAFLDRTKHKMYFFFPSPFMILPMFLGLLVRNRR